MKRYMIALAAVSVLTLSCAAVYSQEDPSIVATHAQLTGTEKSPLSVAAGPLRVHPENPRYFTDGSGKAIYLTGSHTWSNLQDQGMTGPAAGIRLRPVSRVPSAAQPQLHPDVGVGASTLGALVRRKGKGSRRLVHRAQSLSPNRTRSGAGRQAEVRPVEVRPGLFRSAARAGSEGGRSGHIDVLIHVLPGTGVRPRQAPTVAGRGSGHSDHLENNIQAFNGNFDPMSARFAAI